MSIRLCAADVCSAWVLNEHEREFDCDAPSSRASPPTPDQGARPSEYSPRLPLTRDADGNYALCSQVTYGSCNSTECKLGSHQAALTICSADDDSEKHAENNSAFQMKHSPC